MATDDTRPTYDDLPQHPAWESFPLATHRVTHCHKCGERIAHGERVWSPKAQALVMDRTVYCDACWIRIDEEAEAARQWLAARLPSG